MRAVTFHGPGDVRVEEVPEPRVREPEDAVVRVTLASVCGTDLHVYHAGDRLGFAPGTRLGHEFLGVVEEVGPSVQSVRPGDRVLASCMIADGTCRRCREGLSYACERWSFFGWGPVWTCGGPVEGGQAELVRVPLADGTLTTVAEEFDDPALDETLLLLSDNMSTAWHGLQQTRAREGRAVVTIGDGAVGLCAIHGAAALGADPIVCLGHHEDRLAIATRLGATATIRVEGEIAAIVDAVRDLTDGEGAPVVIDAVSSPDSLALAQACTRPEGAIACLGLGHLSGPSPVIDWTDQFLRNLTITGGMVPGRRHVPALLGLVAAGRLDLSPVVTHRLPLADATAGYRMMADRREGAVKIALSPG